MKYLVIKMYEEIEKLIHPNYLSSFEYTKLQELLGIYTEEQIINVYKKYGYKPIEYVKKVLPNIKKTPSWLNKEIVNQPLDTKDRKEFEDFKNFIEGFRNDNKRKDT